MATFCPHSKLVLSKLTVFVCVVCTNSVSNKVNALSPTEASLYCGEAFVLWGGWRERKRERAGHDGKGEERRELPPFSSSHRPPRAFYFFRLLIF